MNFAVSIGVGPPFARLALAAWALDRQFLWWLIAVAACIAGMVFVGVWAWLHYARTTRHPELLEDIPADEKTAISQFPKTRYERRDADIGGVLLFVLALAIVGIMTHLIVYEVWLHSQRVAMRRDQQVHALPQAARRQPPSPRLQWDPEADMNYMRAAEDEILNNYGWADHPGGAVRVPIKRAIQLTAQRGLPSRAGPVDDDSAALLNQAAASGPLQPGQALSKRGAPEQPRQIPNRTYLEQEHKPGNP